MTFQKAKPVGWTTRQNITATQINTIDANQANAVDGDAGGDYSPSPAITLKTGAARLKAEAGTIEYQTGAYPKFANTLSVYQMVPISPCYITNDTASSSCLTMGNDFSISGYNWVQDYYITGGSIASDPYMLIPFYPRLPYATLDSVTFYLNGNDMHEGTVPARMPILYLVIVNSSGTALNMLTLTDSASFLTYDGPHSTTESGLGLTLDYSLGYNYYWKLKGEGGTNSSYGTLFYGIKVKWQTDYLQP